MKTVHHTQGTRIEVNFYTIEIGALVAEISLCQQLSQEKSILSHAQSLYNYYTIYFVCEPILATR